MKKLFSISAVLIVLGIAACASGASAGSSFSDVLGKDWNLIQVQINGNDTGFDRSAFAAQGSENIFTLKFDADRLSGTGSLNRYFAPYTLGEKQEISIQTIAGTLMFPFNEPEKLKESEYFAYLQSAAQWKLVKGNLQLSGTAKDGSAVTLVFAAGE